ncbi:uncharacterized protein BKA55DRAFT_543435 [Fusarium redolens]|uniref:Uncharacterized protein n=1 Tax=Fusarium redolens TaxID=48865 RepID=A0A9P9K1F2_FUSRE|nr:uncharacterized protein BKA55DRAFT_543435 [Fusarium redolens]KAH7236789.1 hypothetical protein BKA55DRAFT_543435 [Fusarium redolens]
MTRDIMRGILRDCGHLCPHSPDAIECLLDNLENTLCCCSYVAKVSSSDVGCSSPCYERPECNIRWEYWNPLSFGWLQSMDFGDAENPVFTDRTKHVLWCDQPGCGTGTGQRWLKLIKLFSNDVGYKCNDLKESRFGYHCGTHESSFPKACIWSLENDVFEEVRIRCPEEKRGLLGSWYRFVSTGVP